MRSTTPIRVKVAAGSVGVEQMGRRAIALEQILKEADRLFVHGRAEFVVELREEVLILFPQLVESAHEDGGWLGTGSASSSGAAVSFGERQLASMIAQKGGLGLAGMISAGLQQRAAEQATPPVPNAAPPSQP